MIKKTQLLLHCASVGEIHVNVCWGLRAIVGVAGNENAVPAVKNATATVDR